MADDESICWVVDEVLPDDARRVIVDRLQARGDAVPPVMTWQLAERVYPKAEYLKRRGGGRRDDWLGLPDTARLSQVTGEPCTNCGRFVDHGGLLCGNCIRGGWPGRDHGWLGAGVAGQLVEIMKSKLLTIVRRISEDSDATEPTGQLQLWFWCAGCQAPHAANVQRADGDQEAPLWTWDQNLDAPTISPSVRIQSNFKDGTPSQVCHFMLEAGQQRFLNDCTHKLVNQTVPLEDMPDWLANE